MQDLLLEISGAKFAHFGGVHAERRAVEIGRRDMAVAGHAGFGDMAGAEIIGGRERPHGGAVIGVPARDDLVRARLVAFQSMILLGRLERHLIGFRARTGEYAGGQRAGCQLGDLGREAHRDIDHIGERAAIMKADKLVIDRFGDAILAVAERAGAGLGAHHVEVGLARRVGDLEAFRRDKNIGAVAAYIVLARQRKQIMVERILGQRVYIGQCHFPALPAI